MLSDVTSAHGDEDSSAGILAKIGKKNLRDDFFYALYTSAHTKSGGVHAHAVACKGLVDVLIVSPQIEFIGDGKSCTFSKRIILGQV